MQIILTFGFALSTFLYLCWADVYLHFPPGSNNRLNGNKENVDKDDRLFDSQVENTHTHTHIYIYTSVVKNVAI